MKPLILSFISGLIFALGLSVSGMTDPSKVKGFLDLLGDWDPSLAFVMVGAIGLNFFSFKKVTKSKPFFADKHQLPLARDIDTRLVLGASLFGLGWGLLGICPGPALVNIATLSKEALLFVVSMTVGMSLFKIFNVQKK